MSILLNRRQMLASLFAVGTSLAISSPVAKASKSLIDQEWARLVEDPWFFDVIDVCGTITEGSAKEPSINADLFSIASDQLATLELLIGEVERYRPLRTRFQWEAETCLFDLREELKENEESRKPKDRKNLQALEKAINDEENGWEAYIRNEGLAALPRFRDIVEDWLAEEIEWEQIESFPRYWGGQGVAARFFEALDADLRRELDIEIVDGDQPGSSYLGARLHSGIDEANAVAKRLGLPFRFRQVS